MPRSAASLESSRRRSKAWYEANKNGKVKERISRNHKVMDDARRVPCEDCGQRFLVCVMQFDHVRGEKILPVSRMRSVSMQMLLAEIAKCEVVCANCHAIRTWAANKRYSSGEDVPI